MPPVVASANGSSMISSDASSATENKDNGEDGGTEYLCYVLRSFGSKHTRTYTGITNNLNRRLLRHNGGLAGGARATHSGRPWGVLAAVRGFVSKNDALCFEWRAKRERAQKNAKLIPVRGGIERRCTNLYEVLCLQRWTQKCRLAAETPLTVTWYGGAPWGLQHQPLPAHVSEKFNAGEFVPELKANTLAAVASNVDCSPILHDGKRRRHCRRQLSKDTTTHFGSDDANMPASSDGVVAETSGSSSVVVATASTPSPAMCTVTSAQRQHLHSKTMLPLAPQSVPVFLGSFSSSSSSEPEGVTAPVLVESKVVKYKGRSLEVQDDALLTTLLPKLRRIDKDIVSKAPHEQMGVGSNSSDSPSDSSHASEDESDTDTHQEVYNEDEIAAALNSAMQGHEQDGDGTSK